MVREIGGPTAGGDFESLHHVEKGPLDLSPRDERIRRIAISLLQFLQPTEATGPRSFFAAKLSSALLPIAEKIFSRYFKTEIEELISLINSTNLDISKLTTEIKQKELAKKVGDLIDRYSFSPEIAQKKQEFINQPHIKPLLTPLPATETSPDLLFEKLQINLLTALNKLSESGIAGIEELREGVSASRKNVEIYLYQRGKELTQEETGVLKQQINQLSDKMKEEGKNLETILKPIWDHAIEEDIKKVLLLRLDSSK